MTNKKYILELTEQELIYLLNLCEDNKEKGDYYGRLDYYLKRQNEVINKINEALNDK